MDETLSSITAQPWIMALFIRDDSERFLLGTGAYEFKDSQLHFAANTFENDTVEVQGNDGVLLAGQVRRSATQEFDGYVGDFGVNQTATEDYRADFLQFFAKNHYYTVVYIFQDGAAIQRKRGFIVDAPEVKEILQKSPEYHVALNFEDVNYYTYAENDEGEEIYTNTIDVSITESTSGGLVWDETGVVWDAYDTETLGAEWELGTGGVTVINVSGIYDVYPVITIGATAVNPTIGNLTTNTTLSYTGSVASGQTLVENCDKQTATLNGTSVLPNISGDWIRLAPGTNRLTFSIDSGDIESCTMSFNGVVG